MLSRLLVSATISVLMAAPAFATTDCDKSIDLIWLDMNGNTGASAQVMIGYVGGGAIRKSANQVGQDGVSRLHAQALTAFSTGKKIRVRYPENGLVCSSTTTTRNDFIGLFIIRDPAD